MATNYGSIGLKVNVNCSTNNKYPTDCNIKYFRVESCSRLFSSSSTLKGKIYKHLNHCLLLVSDCQVLIPYFICWAVFGSHC